MGVWLDRLAEPNLCPSSTACILPPLPFRLAHEQGMLEEREQQQAAVARLRQQLADREAQVDELHQQLRQLHADLAAASEGLQATAASHSVAAEGAAARLEAAGRCTQQLVQAVRLLLETLAQLGSAVAAAAGRQPVHDTSSQVGQRGVNSDKKCPFSVVAHPCRRPCCLSSAAYTPASIRRRTQRRLRQRPATLLAWWAWMQTTLLLCCCLGPASRAVLPASWSRQRSRHGRRSSRRRRNLRQAAGRMTGVPPFWQRLPHCRSGVHRFMRRWQERLSRAAPSVRCPLGRRCRICRSVRHIGQSRLRQAGWRQPL